MKISNETKIGALTVIAVALLILGFNFLKGRNILNSGHYVYTNYNNTKGLLPSNPVFINGYQVGSVYEIHATDKNIRQITVAIKLNQDYNIPVNSVTYIKDNPLGSPSIDILMGNSATFIHSGDTLRSITNNGILADLSGKIGPVADELQVTLRSLDSTIRNVNLILDPRTRGNLQSVVANLSRATAGLAESSVSLQAMMDPKTGSLAQSLDHVNRFTANLESNNQKISQTLDNARLTSEKLSRSDIDGVINSLKSSAVKLDTALNKLSTSNGTLGALLNDRQLYNNLNQTITSLHILMDDLRAHPKRYVSISVFGKKDKSNYLKQPLPQPDSLARP